MTGPDVASGWPKKIAELTPDQKAISEDFYQHWLTVLPQRFSIIESFNHSYPLRSYFSNARTLEIGAGVGAHLHFEDLKSQEYVTIELRADLADALRQKFPSVKTIVGDCQERIGYPDSYFDRALAIHVLEHLPDLPSALDQVLRVLKPGGQFSVVIPCDPGLAYSLARNISARRIFEKRYNQSYDWFIKSEHINTPAEIVGELKKRFSVVHRSYFPLVVPCNDINLVTGLTLRKMS